MKTSITLLAAVLALGTASAASAQTFSGPRVEATVGWDQLRFDLDRLGGSGTEKKSGVGYGVTVGYDVPLQGGLVAGIEAGANFSNVDDSVSDGTTTWGFHARRDIDVAARLGARLGSKALVYGKLGYTNFQLGTDVTDAAGTTNYRTNLDGLVAGGGVEVAINPKAYWKAEYRYSNYEQGVSRNDVVTGIGIRF